MPWATVPGVRSMARAAVTLGQPVVVQSALRAGCFHGTDCVWIAKNLQAKSFHGNRGPFFKGVENCFVQHIPCEIGPKPAPPATRPVFWTPGSGPSLARQAARAMARATWSAATSTRSADRGPRTTDQVDQVHQAGGLVGHQVTAGGQLGGLVFVTRDANTAGQDMQTQTRPAAAAARPPGRRPGRAVPGPRTRARAAELRGQARPGGQLARFRAPAGHLVGHLVELRPARPGVPGQ